MTIDHDTAAAGAHELPDPRPLGVAAAQLGPIGRHEPRHSVVGRLISMLEEARAMRTSIERYLGS